MLQGGSSSIYDIAYKTKQILEQFLPTSFSFNLHCKPDIISAPLWGLYALSNCQQIRNNSITKEEYLEHGEAAILHKEIQ